MILIPQLLTGCRLMMGAGALVVAETDRLYVAATLVCLGGVTDGLDGFLARRLGVVSSFGALFDYFADYVCYVLAPWAIARALLTAPSPVQTAVLMLPLLTAAIRYSRNGLIAANPAHDGS